MLDALVKVAVPRNEYEALAQMCEMDCRMPDEQLRYLLRQEAARRGYLQIDERAKENNRDAGNE
jgi:hypothetical protein